MPAIHARHSRLPDGWAENVRVTLDGLRIATVVPDAPPGPRDVLVGALMPALSNVHSHAFQRAMAGRTERRAKDRESFWTWRKTMYRFANALTPDQAEAIATLAFAEMLEAGFAAVGEFHYLHHAPGGADYADPAEMSSRIVAAAAETGIGLTHLPVLYARGGADGRAPTGDQARFACDVDRFAALVAAAKAHVARLPADAGLGVAPHSLRAVTPDDLSAVTGLLAPPAPIHLHVAEQPREVAEVEAALGARPVDWLLANAEVGPRWTAIHATHMDAAEIEGLARSGATAGLCPVTEANLGDGAFPGPAFLAAGGRFGVGTDSNVRISTAEELRTLEYSQRQRHLARNVLVSEGSDTGEALYLAAADGGAHALARDAGRIAPGALADLVGLDTRHPTLAPLAPAQIASAFVFSGGAEMVREVWSAGRHVVHEGRHRKRDRIRARYLQALRAPDVLE